MKLLDALISTCEIEEYAERIRENELDIYTFKILSDADLQLLGIDDEEKRKKVLEYASDLQIPSEKLPEFNVNKEYLKFVLSQMCLQLTRHAAILSIHLNRNDIVVGDIKLQPAAVCLHNNIKSLAKRLNRFETKMLGVVEKPRIGNSLIISGILTLIGLVFIKFYIK